MPFNPNVPQPFQDLDANVVRNQLNSLKDLIDAVPLQAANKTVAHVLPIYALSLTISDPPTQAEVQAISDKLDVLLDALKLSVA